MRRLLSGPSSRQVCSWRRAPTTTSRATTRGSGSTTLLTRRDQATGKAYGPDEAVGIEDAIRSYTINGAYLTYDEKTRGLEIGKLADLVVVDLADIHELERDPDICFKMRGKVLLTMVGGEVRYTREGFLPQTD